MEGDNEMTEVGWANNEDYKSYNEGIYMPRNTNEWLNHS